MTSREEIALQLTLKTIEDCKYSSIKQMKSLPYEVYNEIYKNLSTYNKS
jgi:hypothetical protein